MIDECSVLQGVRKPRTEEFRQCVYKVEDFLECHSCPRHLRGGCFRHLAYCLKAAQVRSQHLQDSAYEWRMMDTIGVYIDIDRARHLAFRGLWIATSGTESWPIAHISCIRAKKTANARTCKNV